ncbi:hypothetical protein [Methanobacterium spitsbergense]|uniref:Uncharacterized protein n=1 Tax=Methanobacterium spitsbergense TaxID=2874285 RepID=A0A8T5UVS9_9EURY|nr:hypothetical protein [Methanobacterium spitsbergense]MBZ2166357.1 hypothetical protein [Methanobacterium spitsbergense]
MSTRTEGTYFGDFRLQINLNNTPDGEYPDPGDNGKLSICNKVEGRCIELTLEDAKRLEEELPSLITSMKYRDEGDSS